ncbi:hypothetical protein LCGC14_2548310 [marine sediment metagenome]|uniref:LexA repressor DNA-binding domain-containing protein n=1 Tax=marine sediment metagenome TaxID=412755 RepID=A0A0F9BBG3_9ZZZZ
MTAPIYGLTPAQADCARVIHALTDFEGKSPSYDEISDEMCIYSKGRVWILVQALIERGWIAPTGFRPPFAAPRAPRALHLTRSPPPFNGNPIAITEAGCAYLEDAP